VQNENQEAPDYVIFSTFSLLVQVSQSIVGKGRALQKTCGILPEGEKKKGRPLSDAVTQTVACILDTSSGLWNCTKEFFGNSR
jgi:hypothetical protein